ncbi:MAG TPA: mandelate racemase/muconate lactonizing enzyme family protein [Hyphomicrobiaceae bacterium]|nr:mandelate racemase/muconate lactonizing enzyme family protein [Hyphomicrobiaceae bacterium]
MTTSVKLLAASLHYPPELVLHTASSGRIKELDELYLVIERDGRLAGFGEIRENVAYLTGLQPRAVRQGIAALVRALDWSQPHDEVAAQFLRVCTDTPAISRALVDTALVDWAARARGIAVSELFGAPFRPEHTTNQSLFVSDDAHLRTMAKRYAARGFRKLKLRVGARSLREDCARLALLRELFGDGIELAIDANGAWPLDDAIANLREMARFDLAYAEQPIAAGNWEAALRLADASPVPIMLDESLISPDDIDRVIEARGKLWAHLKIIKLGGVTPTISCARRLAAAEVPFMIGQMNEGAAATAAAFHCTITTNPAHAELYGADRLIDDPVQGVSYANGTVRVERAPGLGVQIGTHNLETLWEIRA